LGLGLCVLSFICPTDQNENQKAHLGVKDGAGGRWMLLESVELQLQQASASLLQRYGCQIERRQLVHTKHEGGRPAVGAPNYVKQIGSSPNR